MKAKITLYSLLFLFVFNIASPALAEGPDFDSVFREGLKNYQEQKYEAAKAAFKKALEQNPKNVSVMTNLALTHHQLGEKGWAIALLRRATHLNPDFSTSSAALDFIAPQLEIKEIPHDIRLSDTLHASLFSKYPLWLFVLLTTIFVYLFSWQMIQYFAERKRSISNDSTKPNFPALSILTGLISIFFISAAAFKVVDQNTVRATIVDAKVNVLSLPDEKAPSLFEIYQGLEVVVQQSQPGWAQVTYPGGLTGWVQQGSIFITNGGN